MSTEDKDVATDTTDFVGDRALVEVVRPLGDTVCWDEVGVGIELEAEVKKDAGDGSGDGETDDGVVIETASVLDIMDDVVDEVVVDDGVVTEMASVLETMGNIVDEVMVDDGVVRGMISVLVTVNDIIDEVVVDDVTEADIVVEGVEVTWTDTAESVAGEDSVEENDSVCCVVTVCSSGIVTFEVVSCILAIGRHTYRNDLSLHLCLEHRLYLCLRLRLCGHHDNRGRYKHRGSLTARTTSTASYSVEPRRVAPGMTMPPPKQMMGGNRIRMDR